MSLKKLCAEIQKSPRPLTEAEIAEAEKEANFGQLMALYIAGQHTPEQAVRLQNAMRKFPPVAARI